MEPHGRPQGLGSLKAGRGLIGPVGLCTSKGLRVLPAKRPLGENGATLGELNVPPMSRQ